jgi:stalled ribosome rescue protein Dom34
MRTVVWLDREEARVFHLSNERMERKVIRAHHQEHHTHRIDDQLERESMPFYQEVADQLSKSEGVLIVGPGVARKHFVGYVNLRLPKLAERIVGCETMDHPTDPEIAAYAFRYFMQGGASK